MNEYKKILSLTPKAIVNSLKLFKYGKQIAKDQYRELYLLQLSELDSKAATILKCWKIAGTYVCLKVVFLYLYTELKNKITRLWQKR